MWLCNFNVLIMTPDCELKHLDYGPASALINSVFWVLISSSDQRSLQLNNL